MILLPFLVFAFPAWLLGRDPIAKLFTLFPAFCFSRFGAIVTIAGLADWSSTPIFCGANGCPPYVFGPGYWLAWAGTIVSLLGRSWIALPKSVERRKFLGSIMFSMGLILAIMGVLFLYAGFDQFGAALVIRSVLVVAGLLMVGAGLNLFFQLESTIITRIRRALQKPLW